MRYNQIIKKRSFRYSERAPVVNKLSIQNAAYIAGLLDADGSFTIRARIRPSRGMKSPHADVAINLTNADDEVLRWVQDVVNAGGVYCHRKEGPRNRAIFRWQLTGLVAPYALMAQIAPFLKIKRERVDFLFEHIDDLLAVKAVWHERFTGGRWAFQD